MNKAALPLAQKDKEKTLNIFQSHSGKAFNLQELLHILMKIKNLTNNSQSRNLTNLENYFLGLRPFGKIKSFHFRIQILN